MAEVFRFIDGRKIEKVMALHRTVQDRLEIEAQFGALKAEGLLASHRYSGDAQIRITEGNVDRHVELDDTRGLDAALSIEYGRKAHIDPDTGELVGGMDGLWILHDAFNLSSPRRTSAKPAHGGDSLE